MSGVCADLNATDWSSDKVKILQAIGSETKSNSTTNDKNRSESVREEDKKVSATEAKTTSDVLTQATLIEKIIYFYFLPTLSLFSFVLLTLAYLRISQQNTKLKNIESHLINDKRVIENIRTLNNISSQRLEYLISTLLSPELVEDTFENPVPSQQGKSKELHSQNTQNDKSTSVSANVNLPYDPQDMVSVYNHDPKLLRNTVAEIVSESSESIQARMLDNAKPLILEKNASRGDYWVMAVKRDKYLLVPKANFRLNEFSFQTLTGIFRIQGSQQSMSRFQLVRPAEVVPSQDRKYWHIESLGVLNLTQ